MTIEALIESLLYIAGEEGMSLSELTEVLDLSESKTKYAAESLKKQLEGDTGRGLMILKVAGRYVLSAKKEAEAVIRRYAQAPFITPLSKAALEILSIIAYKQPITRVQIDHIRGVQSGASLQKLQLRGLVEEKGRVEGPGRPLLYGTTDYFLNYFGLNQLSDLPELPDEESDSPGEMDLFFGSSSFEESIPKERE